MPQIKCDSQTVTSESLINYCSRLLIAHGLSERDAENVAESLVESNLRGIDSHGVARLPHYLSRIESGSIKAQPRMVFEKLGASVGQLDGGHGLGQLVMSRATDEVIDLARESGAGWVSISNSSHCGALAHYGLRIAEEGMIGFVFTHVDPMVLAYGAKEAFCGTNPICITAPGKNDRSLCLDMATSVVPWNTIANAAMEGIQIPEDWAVDESGMPTTDAKSVAAIHAFGGHKGSGLGLMIDILCSMLSGAPFGPHIPKMYGDMKETRRLGGLVGAIRIENFTPLDTFRNRISDLVEEWGNLPSSSPSTQVFYPGEPEKICRKKRLAHGIPVGLSLLDIFRDFAAKHELEQHLPSEIKR